MAKNDGWLATERRTRALQMVQERGTVAVAELSGLFGVSDVTVRTDLAYLEKRGLVLRTHGGATLSERHQRELSFAAREQTNVELKRRIGLAAAELVANDNAIILDASTTALQVARALKQRQWTELTVVTNGIYTALELLGVPGVTAILTGGVVRETAISLTGPLGEELLHKVHATIGFFGSAGLTPDRGLMEANLHEAQLKSAMAAASERVVAVVDHTKLGQVALATFAPPERIALVITDSEADPERLAELRAAGLDVRVV